MQKCKGLCFIPSCTGDREGCDFAVVLADHGTDVFNMCLLVCWSTSLPYHKLQQKNNECNAKKASTVRKKRPQNSEITLNIESKQRTGALVPIATLLNGPELSLQKTQPDTTP